MKHFKQLKFIILLGIVSLFSDMTFEGAHSIIGQYFASIGATGAVIGFIFGLGELLSYGLRAITGYLIDKTERYWEFTFIGYLCNIISIPLIALTSIWPTASGLILIERVGKALRSPARDAMLSYASQKTGRGIGFGIHQVLDQTGGFLGPLFMAFSLFIWGSFHLAFALLIIPAFITLLFLIIVSKEYPKPKKLEVEERIDKTKDIPKLFWFFLFSMLLVAFGYVDFPLMAFHFAKVNIINSNLIPLLYIIGMAFSALSTLFFGWLYDKLGILTLLISISISAFFAPFIFIGNFNLAILGMCLWGLGIGAQRSLIKAVIGDLVSKRSRATAYGFFNTGYGIAWFIGSSFLGILYDKSISILVIISVVTQLLAIPLILLTIIKSRNSTS